MPTQHRPRSRAHEEQGFSIIEATIALGLVFAVLVGMLATVATGVRGVVHSRQQSVAVGLAREVLELSRSLGYAEVGHDLDDDATLATDPALTSIGTNAWTFEGERLAGSSINWPGRDPDLPSPFYPHIQTVERNGTTFTVRAYVTHVDPAASSQPGAPYKRVAVRVDWDKAQYVGKGSLGSEGSGGGGGGSGTSTSSTTSTTSTSSTSTPPACCTAGEDTLIFDTLEPPDPLLQGLSDVDGGVVSITGYVANLDLDDAFLWFPYAHGEVDSQFLRRVSGFAAGARSQLNVSKPLTTSDLLGCTVTNSVKTAECRGVKATTVGDNDQGTAPGPHDHDGPLSGPGGTIRRQDLLGITMSPGASADANLAESKSTAEACGAACPSPYLFTESDGLPYHWSEASGPGSASIFFDAGAVEGNLVTSSAPATARSVVDRDDVAGNGKVTVTGDVTHPAISVIGFASAVYDALGITLLSSYNGAVRIGATSASVFAEAGPGAAAPLFTASAVDVQLFDTCSTGTVLPGYVSHTFTLGTASSATACAELTVAGKRVLLDTTVSTVDQVVKTDVAGGVYYESEVSVTSWLRAVTRLQVWDGSSLVADLTVDLDYGRLRAHAKYAPAGA